MRYSPAFTFSSSYLRGVWLRAGLRLLGARQFQAFLAAGAYLSRGSSYYFGSSGCVRSLLTSVGSNPTLKRICLQRPTYFYR